MAPGDLITRRGQLQYGGLLLGPGTPYRWQTLTGWEDLPPLDSGTVARADAHGAMPGRLLAQPRTVGLEGLIVRARRDRIGAVVGALSAGTGPVEDELPLVIWWDDRGPLLCWARAVRRHVPTGRGYSVGTIVGGAVEFEATDPRRYGLDEQETSAGLPVPEPGLDWQADAGEGLAWPLDFGEPGATGNLSAYNSGDAPAHPVIEFRGPVVRPALTNIGTGDALEYDITLAAGDVLTVDTGAGTVTLNGTASRLYTATTRSVPEQTFTLSPGASDFTFRADPGPDDAAASAVVRWRPAYW